MVKSLLAFVLVVLVLLQTFRREVLVVNYGLNRTAITARFCVNKERPALHCNGQCYLARQLKKQQQRENRLPNLLKGQAEMLPTGTGRLVPTRPAAYPAVASHYYRGPEPAVLKLSLRAVFHPPQA